VVKLPVCFEPRSAATALRATLERLGWEYTRSDDTRAFTQVAFVIPFQRAAHLFRYEIPHGDLLLERLDHGCLLEEQVPIGGILLRCATGKQGNGHGEQEDGAHGRSLAETAIGGRST
jgi:hypothetical protein